VFSLHPAMKPKITDSKAKPRPVMFCGLAAKDIAAWQPDSPQLSTTRYACRTATSCRRLGLWQKLLIALLIQHWWGYYLYHICCTSQKLSWMIFFLSLPLALLCV